MHPVGTPDVLRALPSLLFDRNSPLSSRRAGLPSLAPWLNRFARQSLPAAARRNAMAITGLMAEALPGWEALAGQIGGKRAGSGCAGRIPGAAIEACLPTRF